LVSALAAIDHNGRRRLDADNEPWEPAAMSSNSVLDLSLPRIAGLILGVSIMLSGPASADALKDQLVPTGKLRVALGISAAGGAYWSTRTETGGYAGVPVDLGKAMADQLGVPVEYVAYSNSGLITDSVSTGA
jgi:polar amino acid transport system substrate-binding protein